MSLHWFPAGACESANPLDDSQQLGLAVIVFSNRQQVELAK